VASVLPNPQSVTRTRGPTWLGVFGSAVLHAPDVGYSAEKLAFHLCIMRPLFSCFIEDSLHSDRNKLEQQHN